MPSGLVKRLARCCAHILVLASVLNPLVAPRIAFASSEVVMDGEFSDWVGRAHLGDPSGDTKQHWDDVAYWYFATNDGVSALYFMIQRYGAKGAILEGTGTNKKEVHYTIFVDLDNNGRFSEPVDATVFVAYYPGDGGFTKVSVFSPNESHSYTGIWGDPDYEGGQRVEFPVPFSCLGIQPGQVIRMVLFAQDGRKDWDNPAPISEYERLVASRKADRVPQEGDLQWSPIPTLGNLGWIALIGAGIAIPVFLKRRGRIPE